MRVDGGVAEVAVAYCKLAHSTIHSAFSNHFVTLAADGKKMDIPTSGMTVNNIFDAVEVTPTVYLC